MPHEIQEQMEREAESKKELLERAENGDEYAQKQLNNVRDLEGFEAIGFCLTGGGLLIASCVFPGLGIGLGGGIVASIAGGRLARELGKIHILNQRIK